MEDIEPHENDVLMGRGGLNNKHSGNEKLRQLARQYGSKYKMLTKKEKSDLSRYLVRRMRELDPPARFLKRVQQTSAWEEVGDDTAREKASQVLRDAVSGLLDQKQQTTEELLPTVSAQTSTDVDEHESPQSTLRYEHTMLQPPPEEELSAYHPVPYPPPSRHYPSPPPSSSPSSHMPPYQLHPSASLPPPPLPHMKPPPMEAVRPLPAYSTMGEPATPPQRKRRRYYSAEEPPPYSTSSYSPIRRHHSENTYLAHHHRPPRVSRNRSASSTDDVMGQLLAGELLESDSEVEDHVVVPRSA